MSGKSSGGPIGVQMTGARSKIAEPAAKPSAGSTTAAVATAPAVWTVPTMKRRRVTVSPSNAPGCCARRCTWKVAACESRARGAECYRSTGSKAACRGARRHRSGAPPPSLGGLVVRCRTARDGRRSGFPDRVRAGRIALGVGLRAQRDHVRQFGHGLEVAERRQALEAERVQAVAGEQREVRIVGSDDAPGGVVLEVALADRLDEQRVGVAALATASPCGCGPSLAVRTVSASSPPSARKASASRSRALTSPPRTPPPRLRSCARCARPCAPSTGTRPRTRARGPPAPARRRGRARSSA